MTDNAYSDPPAGMMDNAYSDSAAEWVRADSLRPWTRNPRRNDAAAKDVARSLIRFGFGAPIVARPNGEIISGHTRLKAVAMLPGLYRKATVAERETWAPDAVQLATAEHPLVPVRMMDLTEQQAHALALVDNKLGELATWDMGTLTDILRDLEADGAALDGLGWTDEEIKALMEPDAPGESGDGDGGEQAMQGTYAVLVTCTDERHQRTLLETFAEEGLECRAWNL